VIVTHSHPDHFGGAARFAKESGARVIGHRSFRFGVAEVANAQPEVSVEDLAAQRDAERSEAAEPKPEPASHAPREPWRQGRTPWGGEPPRPSFKMRMRWRLARVLGGLSFVPRISDPVSGGDVLRLAGREWFVVHTPGHTEDHFCLHDPEEGVFLAGDHVLPTITPHISGLSTRADPLAAYFESLDRVATIQPVQKVLPAHGHPFDDLAERCRGIQKHHVERLERVKAIGRELGLAPVEAFSQRLFHPRSWGSMAESETFAHLEHLRLLGLADSRRDGEGKLLYTTG
jgi:glyoxylase-like metal-dependent hydrolase (beta-lactamase superfamily II)